MPPFWAIILGLGLLALFIFGGSVAGQGRRDHMASAARAFVLPWIGIALVNLWIRWWDKQPLSGEIVWLLPVIGVPVAVAFIFWKRFRA